VSGVPVDGFMVVRGPGDAIHLVDPTTGKASARTVPVAFNASIAVSPDGQRVAFHAPEGTGGGPRVAIAEVALEDGLPELRVLEELPVLGVDLLRWNPDGDRLFTRDLWLNPATGDVTQCEDDTPPITISPIIAFPGGHRYVCDSADALYDDGRFISPARGDGDDSTADGQFYNHTLQVPSATVRPFVPDSDFDPLWANNVRAHLKLPDGRFVLPSRGVNGKYVVAVPAGFVTVYQVLESDNVPLEAIFVDYHDIFPTGTWQREAETWPVREALEPYLNDGEGRSFQQLGLSADGQKLIYLVNSWVIENATDGTNVISQTPVESALVEIARDGSSRGFKTSTLGERFALISDARVVNLRDGEWLVKGGVQTSLTGIHEAWFGYVGGKAVRFSDTGQITPDGRWVFGSVAEDKGGRLHCFRAVGQPGGNLCFPQVVEGQPVGLMGQGLKAAHASDGPMLTAISRPAAWPGAVVTLHGAHFGAAPGSVTVGGTQVPAADITRWSEHTITFQMSAVLPEAGDVHVITAAGTGGLSRAFKLHRTALVATPFAGVKDPATPLGQGLTALDLGDLGTFMPTQGPVILDPKSRAPDGRFVVFSAGAPTSTPTDVLLRSGPYERTLRFTLEDRIAEAASWQFVAPETLTFETEKIALVTLAGDLIERSSKRHPTVARRVTFADLQQRLPFGGAIEFGLPDFWRESGPDTWVANNYGSSSAIFPGWSVRRLTGFVGPDGTWGTPVYAPTPRFQMPNYFRGVAADGDLMLNTGADELGGPGGAYRLSTNRGATFGPVITVPSSVLPGQGALQEPLYVAASTPFFLVFEAGSQSQTVLGLHGISRDGTLTPNIAPVPPHASVNSAFVRNAPLLVATRQGKVLLHFGETNTLVLTDFDAPGARAWAVVPSAADARHVRNFYRDPVTDDVYAVRDDGTVARATAAGGWNDWAPFDLQLSLALPTRIRPVALGRTPDRRWLVLAQLFDGAPGAAMDAPSALGRGGWLLGPTP
jgi:hypothetical protein